MWRASLIGILAAGALAAPAHAEFPGQDLLPISRSAAGAPGDAPSRNAVISQDKRFGRVVAFESAATNLVAGAGGAWNVYVVRRDAATARTGRRGSSGRSRWRRPGCTARPRTGPRAKRR